MSEHKMKKGGWFFALTVALVFAVTFLLGHNRTVVEVKAVPQTFDVSQVKSVVVSGSDYLDLKITYSGKAQNEAKLTSTNATASAIKAGVLHVDIIPSVNHDQSELILPLSVSNITLNKSVEANISSENHVLVPEVNLILMTDSGISLFGLEATHVAVQSDLTVKQNNDPVGRANLRLSGNTRLTSLNVVMARGEIYFDKSVDIEKSLFKLGDDVSLSADSAPMLKNLVFDRLP